ncbi:hypothetical protein [Actinomarinicola tropica]|uniref:Polysaccharide deacetylase family protein n=1 Tax=Actinomarinicola tropica TaxID=2789776 RepID=A0A5Q2RKM9_9ACTN|nr:hypothetical protein [Actinomarinicola tropica]QGG94617.1 hypothetical protein GH723_05565 [Actinomarinicola tropica]
MPRPSRARLVALALVVGLVAGCSSGDDGEPDAGPSTTRPEVTTSTAPPFVPVTAGTDEEGDPLPPPVHAVFSVVVRGDTSWSPYASRELTGLDAEAADAVVGRVRQIEQVLRDAGVVASFELAYGAVAAICERAPELLDELESRGHAIGLHARTLGESFRAVRSLEEGCGRTTTIASGLPAMADPVGPDPTTAETLFDAVAVLDVHGIDQVVGEISPLCEGLGLAGHTNEYGTDAFTAPWRSAWFDGNACIDSPAGEIVLVDQVALTPAQGAVRVGPDAVDQLASPFTQTLGWAADHRYDEPEEYPAPGVFTWGVTVRLDDLLPEPPDPEAEAETEGTDPEIEGTDPETEDEAAPPPDPRVAPLSTEVLTALAELLEEWREALDDGRVTWVLPADIAAILRPNAATAPSTDG